MGNGDVLICFALLRVFGVFWGIERMGVFVVFSTGLGRGGREDVGLTDEEVEDRVYLFSGVTEKDDDEAELAVVFVSIEECGGESDALC